MSTAVLLAVYNGSAHLPALLDSLRAQTDTDFSVLIQDDGSDDDSVAVLKSYCTEDPRFAFGNEQGKHLGPVGNFVSLIRQASADYLLLCDQDDIWEREKVQLLKEEIRHLENQYSSDTPLLVHSDCSLIDRDGNLIGDSFFRHQGWDPAVRTLPPLLVQNNVTGCTLIMNTALKDLIAMHARSKELFMHDWFVALTAASFGKIGFVDRPLTRYRQHGDNAIGASSQSLVRRGLAAFRNRGEAKRRIRLTYTHTKVFRKLYGDLLPADAQAVISAYLATERMRKIKRVLTVRRLGCVMQSPVTRMGQILFG